MDKAYNALFLKSADKLLKPESMPEEEQRFQKLYQKAPSFLSIHMGVKADVLPAETECHHLVLEVGSTFPHLCLPKCHHRTLKQSP
jgi:phytoene dehydrogenase-like protein